MDKPWLLTRETFNDMRGDETALLYLTIQRILRAQHLKTLEWLETVMGTYPIDEPSRIYTPLRHWREFLAQARKDVADG